MLQFELIYFLNADKKDKLPRYPQILICIQYLIYFYLLFQKSLFLYHIFNVLNVNNVIIIINSKYGISPTWGTFPVTRIDSISPSPIHR